MSFERVLESWEDYDNRKNVREDSRYFACSEDWEVEYLICKIIEVFPNQIRDRVKQAIMNCARLCVPPGPGGSSFNVYYNGWPWRKKRAHSQTDLRTLKVQYVKLAKKY